MDGVTREGPSLSDATGDCCLNLLSLLTYLFLRLLRALRCFGGGCLFIDIVDALTVRSPAGISITRLLRLRVVLLITLTVSGGRRYLGVHLTKTNDIGMRGGAVAAGRTAAVAVPARNGRCPAVRAGEPHAAGDHRPEVLVVGEVDEEVNGGVEDL